MKRKLHKIKRPNITLVTKASFLILLLFVTHVNATVLKCQNEMVSVNLKNKPLDKVFETITKSSGYRFFYETSEIDVHKKINLESDKVRLSELLRELSENSNLNYSITSNQIVVTKKLHDLNEVDTSEKKAVEAVPNILKGTIVDDTGFPLAGATAHIKGTGTGVISDIDGNFELELPTGEVIIIVSFVGYQTQQVNVTDKSSITITLLPDAAALDEVIVVGYGSLSKKRVTGAVASVSPSAIADIPVVSVENAIVGQVAGVQVQEVSGEPGSSPNIRVRGSGSISAGNDPLFVVDGIPISKNLTTLGIQGDLERRGGSFQAPPVNPLATINPNDIASIEILKDASAAAIYGSRGGNGVVLISTKSGTASDKGRLSFDTFYTVQSVANKVDLMNSEELIDYTRDSRNNAYLSDNPDASADDPMGPGDRDNENYEMPESFLNWDGTDTDWQDLIFKTGSIQSYNLSYDTPLSNKTSYHASGGYFKQEGIIPNSSFERYNLMLNLNSKLNDKFTLDLRITPTITENQRQPASAPYFARPPGIVYSALVQSPTVSPYNSDGSPNQTNNQSHLGGGTTTASNPLAIIDAIDDKLFQFQTRASLGLSYEIQPGLTLKTFGGSYVNLYNRDFYRANTLLYREATEGESYAQASSSTELNWLWENTLNWEKEYGVHYFNAVAGYSAQKDIITIKQVQADNFPDDLVHTISGGQVFAGSSAREEWSLASALFRMNYSYDDKYLFTGTFRSDTSSRFGKDNQTGYFPSFSLGWRVSEEDFMSSLDFVSELKVRFSWGETGNFEIPNYGAIGLLSPNNYNYSGNEANGLMQSTIPNPELTWEKSAQTNVGLELGVINNRIFLLADYYRTITSDLLLNVGITSVSGFETTLQNIGEVKNEGFEIALKSRNLVGAFTWETGLNFSTNKNEVLSLNGDGEPIYSEGSAGIRHITQVGEAIGSYYGYVVDGIYQNEADIQNAPVDTQAPNAGPGDFRFKDVNGDGEITPDDRTVTGSYFPDFTWGISNKFTYKGVDFTFLIQGVEGNEVLNLTSRHLKNGEANFNSYAVFNNRWKSEQDPGDGNIPRADRLSGNHGNNNRISSFQVEDGSFIRLRNMTLGYTLPSKEVFGESIDRLRFFVTGTNLFTITDYLGYNPEVSNSPTSSLTPGEDYGAYPLTKSFTVGLNLSF
ncbi:TonB-dependent receptor [Formosa algae]|uniref:TonB-linked SusC/RagA family outer membrane protein n=1 Tax=Formosa algae TaxID=225843 RepID=A0A9X0YJC3_9FLAO|nr:TonB-dependent receptor [Formosa algae]MBP1839887.1 TonB-linked SusC/RagA family outer membrane protein [Formosa algae]MDQ0335486.1 TonB-linked SusC/RagA family outer membrane protein [Formosa algae]OEI81809.1 SusC/RagA family TonB-linked outer membrane protein [Formosa algae]